MFGCWLKSFHSSVEKMMLIGVAAVCWSLWLTRNDVVFQRTTSKSFLQVVFRAAHWIRSRGILSKEEAKVQLRDVARRMEVQVLSFFAKADWNLCKRIEFPAP
jgi:hypothetical protein